MIIIENIIFYTSIFLLVILISVEPAKADVAPKPSVEFTFEYSDEKVSIISGDLLVCSDPACAEYENFRNDLQCENEHCWTWASRPGVSFAEYHKLVIIFDNRVLESNVFGKQNFQASYDVLIRDDSLVVSENLSEGRRHNPLFVILAMSAILLTVFVEVIAASIYIIVNKTRWKLLLNVFLANLLSVPFIWFVLVEFISWGEADFFVAAESFAVLFETTFLYYTSRKIGISFRQALLLSFILNLISILVGSWVIFVF